MQIHPDRTSDLYFRIMAALFTVSDAIVPYVGKRASRFGVQPGMVVVDYGCGPGRYAVHFAHLVGPQGTVYAVDIHPLALQTIKKKIVRHGLSNVIPVLADGYNSTLPDGLADMVCAIDMFFAVSQPSAFLAELKRITKPDGMLILDDGHQSRASTKAKVLASGLWHIEAESRDHLKCTPLSGMP